METPSPSATANRQIARAAGTVMIAFALSNVVGLVRQILVSKAFGTSAQMDAFNAAVIIPDVLFNLMAGGALASAFIPTLSAFVTKDNREGAWRLASAVLNLVGLSLTLVAMLAALIAPQIVQYILFALAPKLDPALKNLTSDMLRIILIAPTVFGVSGLIMGILNTHQKFWLPALAPVFNWIGWILGLIFLVPSMGIYGLAWGYVMGALLHLCIQLPGLLRLPGRRYFPTLGLNNPAVREVFRLMAPRLFGVAVVQLNFVVNAMIAYSQPEGSLTSLNVARMVMTLPLFVIASAIATAALPTFSAQVANDKVNEMRTSLASTLRGVILLSLPASLGLIFLRGPIVTLLFQYGKFSGHSTDLTAWALLWYAAGLVGFSVVEILSRAFYALHDTKTPVLVGAAAMGLNVIFSFAFSALFARIGWAPHGGLALANSLATALEMVGLLVLMRRRLNGMEGRRLLQGTIQAGVAVLGMSLALWGCLELLRQRSAVWVVLISIPIGIVVYGIFLALLRTPELQQGWRFVMGYLTRKTKNLKN